LKKETDSIPNFMNDILKDLRLITNLIVMGIDPENDSTTSY